MQRTAVARIAHAGTSAAAAVPSIPIRTIFSRCTCEAGRERTPSTKRWRKGQQSLAGHTEQRHSFASAPLPSPLRHPDVTSSDTSGQGPLYTTFSIPSSSSKGYGQPLPSTHPHLLQHGELTEGIPASEYEERRRKLMQQLPDGSIVVLPGGRLQYASQGIYYKFRQFSDFYYLTGWLEADAAVVLEKTSSSTSGRGYKMTFFCQSRDHEAELWEGPRNGPNGAVDIFGADQALDIGQFTSHLRTMLDSPSTSGNIYVDLPETPFSAPRAAPRGVKLATKNVFNFLTGSSGGSGSRKSGLDLGLVTRKADYDAVVSILQGREGGRQVKSLKELTEGLRMVKSDNEVRLMRKAAEISGEAHAKVMRLAQPGVPEHTLVSAFEYHCSLAGSLRPAYVPVCASGLNNMYLHYTSNNSLLPSASDNALVLLDAGCEYASYAADITRTFPVNGTFTPAQKDLYTAVLNTVKSCVKLCTEKETANLYDLHEKSRNVLVQELKQLGGGFSSMDKEGKLFARIYPHFIGHPLGLDLHDCPTFQRHMPLRAGHVVTIEPGVFIPAVPELPKEYHNIAIRLEDEILVGKEDPINLSANCPIEIVDVEACCQGLLERRDGD